MISNHFTLMNQYISDHFISQPRFERYLIACGKNTADAFDLYCSNLLVTKCFCPIMSVFEVALRNRLNAMLTGFFKDNDWILNQKNRFMSHPRLGKQFAARKQVETAEQSLIRKNLNVKTQIVTELTLGFWVRFFQSDHFGLLKAEPLKIFSNLPQGTKRDTIHKMLKAILDFRNRVYHNEPICFGIDVRRNQSIIDLTVAQDVYENIYTILFWIGGNNLSDWVQKTLTKNHS